MEFKNWSNPEFQFAVPPNQGDFYSFPPPPHNDWVYTSSGGRDMEPRTTEVSAMQRYLDERDPHILPTAYPSEADGYQVHAWLGPRPPMRALESVRSHDTSSYVRQRTASPGNNSLSGSSSSYVSSNPGEPTEASSWSSPELAIVDYAPGSMCPDRVAYGFGQSLPIDSNESSTRTFGSCVAMHDVQNRADESPDETVGVENGNEYAGYLGFMDAEDGYQPLDGGNDCSATELAASSCHILPVKMESRLSNSPLSPSTPLPHPRRDPSVSPNIRRRRAPSSISTSMHNCSHKVSKRRGVAPKYADEPAASRAFPCSLAVYGCPATFGSKNEWKRHINTQHMRLDFWRCDQCPATRASSANASTGDGAATGAPKKYNDFNRKDLFIQHVRRMHPESISTPTTTTTTTTGTKKGSGSGRANNGHNKSNTTSAATAQAQSRADATLLMIAARCRCRRSAPPSASGCLFCDAHFAGDDTWDERLEHIGRHFENRRKGEEEDSEQQAQQGEGAAGRKSGTESKGGSMRLWRADPLVEAWMLEQGILVRQPGRSRQLVLAP